MKRKFLDFSILDNFGFNRCYRAVVEDGASSTETETVETTETTETEDNTEKEPKKDSSAFRGKGKTEKVETTPTKITLDDNIEYDIDENGNATLDGKIVHDKSKVAEFQSKQVKDYKPLPIWDVLKAELSDEENPYELPEEIVTGKNKDGKVLTVKDQFDKLREIITENTDFTDGDTFLAEYLEAKGKGKTADDFLKSKTVALDYANMTVEQKALESLKDIRDSKATKYKDKDGKWKEGWTDDDLQAEVENMKPIELEREADKYDANITVRQKQAYAKQIADYNKNFDASFTKVEKENIQNIGNYLKNIEGKNTIAGIEFSEAEMTEYRKELPSFIKRTVKVDESGVKRASSPADELLTSVLAKPEDTFELLPYLWMLHKKKLKGYSARLKEKVKETLDKTLDSQPDSFIGNVKVIGKNSQKFRGK